MIHLSTILTVAVVDAMTTIPWQFCSLAKCSAFDASIVATPLPCHAEETLKKPRSRTLSTVGKAERKVGGQRMREDPKCQNLDQATSSYLDIIS